MKRTVTTLVVVSMAALMISLCLAGGESSRTDIKGFGSCCNPMNLCFDRKGVLYTSKSGMGRVKRYTVDGTYLGLVGYVGTQRFSRAGQTAEACSNIAIAITSDEKRVYVMDFSGKIIRVPFGEAVKSANPGGKYRARRERRASDKGGLVRWDHTA